MVRLNVAGVEDKRASMHRAMPILPSNILECFPLRSFCGGNTTFIFRCHVTSKQPIESMRLHYTIAREALIVKGSLSGVDMRHGEGVVSYMALSVCAARCRPTGYGFLGPRSLGKVSFLRLQALWSTIQYPFIVRYFAFYIVDFNSIFFVVYYSFSFFILQFLTGEEPLGGYTVNKALLSDKIPMPSYSSARNK